MASLFDIGKSGIQSYRQALTVTGQNIANINTDGYNKRAATLEEVAGSQGGLTAIASQSGLGVRVSDIRRSFDAFLLNKKFSSSAEFERITAYADQLRELENTLLPNDADLGTQIGNFFGVLQDVAAAPGDIPPRLLAIEQGKSLAEAFNFSASQIETLNESTLRRTEDTVTAINILTEQLADVNSRLLSAGQSGKSSNSLLDNRDKLIGEIAELAEVTVTYEARGVATLRLGDTIAGPVLVSSKNFNKIDVIEKMGQLQPLIVSGGSKTATSQISKGLLAGLVDSYRFLSDTARNIDFLATSVARGLNDVHNRGVTLDGERGMDMFSTSDLEFTFGVANKANLSAELAVSNTSIVPTNRLDFIYMDDANRWALLNPEMGGEAGSDNGEIVSVGNVITGPGFQLQVSGTPQSGDTLSLDYISGAARNMSFRLIKPQEIAAALPTVVEQDIANESDADLEAVPVAMPSYDTPASIDAVFDNSLSPLDSTFLLRDGVVAAVPAGTTNLDLVSYKQQSSVNFDISENDLFSAMHLDISISEGPGAGAHRFNLNYQVNFPQAANTADWEDLGDLARAMALGIIQTDSGQTLGDLGLFASGHGGQLTLASSEGNFTNGAVTLGTGTTLSGRLTSAQSASDIQIFTREGRHIAGTPLTQTQIADIITPANGFSTHADYFGNYLNDTEEAYRGMDMEILKSGGLQELTLGANGTSPLALGGSGNYPNSATDAYSAHFQLVNGNTAAVQIPAGASAGYVANLLNTTIGETGLVAKATNRVMLSNFDSPGEAIFNLEGKNQEPITIRANVGVSQLTVLETAINEVSELTGIVAQVTDQGDRIILVSDAADDILISSLSPDSPQFSGQIIDTDGTPVSDSVVFGQASDQGRIDSGRFAGQVQLVSGESFNMQVGDVISQSALNPVLGGQVKIDSSLTGDRKTITFAANAMADDNLGVNVSGRALAAAAQYSLTLPSYEGGPSFQASLASGDLADISQTAIAEELVSQMRNNAVTVSLSGQTAITPENRPQDGDSVTVKFANDTYTIRVNAEKRVDEDGNFIQYDSYELEIDGGEPGRLTAYFDTNNKLQIVAGGSLSAAAISIPGDDLIAGNNDAAERFGISVATQRYAGTNVVLADGERSMDVLFNDQRVSIGITPEGVVSTDPNVPDLTVRWEPVVGDQGRLILEHDLTTGPLSFTGDRPSQALGFRVADFDIKRDGEHINVRSTNGRQLDVTARAESLADKIVSLRGLPQEDLIIVVTGGGARNLGAQFDLAPIVPEIPSLDIEVVNETGNMIEVIDSITGHSIASRRLDQNGQAEAAGFAFKMRGVATEGDVFHIVSRNNGAGDARNINAMMALQTVSLDGQQGGGFRDIFAAIVTEVGAAVRSSDNSLASAEAVRDAAVEAELSFSGVNLDTEAAALIEFQQAYQASARILSTAREMFSTLMDSI